MDQPPSPPCAAPGPTRASAADVPALAGHGVDIWLCAYRDGWDSPALDVALSEEEKERGRRFRLADDRLRHRVTRALVRRVLSRYAPVAPADWRFVVNAHGCPAIAPGHAAARGLHFNVSHTAGLIALAVGRRELGVDVESLARKAALELAPRFFSPAEAETLAAAPPAQQSHSFYAYWTLKEAYVKARGMGLALPLDGFGFELASDGRIACWMAPELHDDPAHWWFARWELSAGYAMALCARRLDGRAPALALRSLHPDGSERPVTALPLAST